MTADVSSSTTNRREWDLVVYGATGDAGTAIAIYIANHIDSYKKSNVDDDDDRFRWAIAGRSEHKLNRLRSRIIVSRITPSANDEIGVLTADVASFEDTSELAKSTRVLISAVGPYTLLGESVYAACAEHGTNYVDITGEVDWVASMKEKYQKRATETGATLCSFAGYDCVPCDITTYLARKVLSECDSESGNKTILTGVETVSQSTGGVMPRGTLRTSILMFSNGAAFFDKLVRFASNHDGNGESGVHWKTIQALVLWLLPRWSPEFGAFTLPHFMGWCNIPVIYNSHASFIDCTFHDRMAVPYCRDCPATGYGLLQTLVLYFVLLVMAPWFLCFQILVTLIPSTTDLMLKVFDSLQYRGNSQKNQQQLDDATTDVWNYVTSSSGSKATVHLHVKGDPGIKCTAALVVETAFSMLVLLDKNELPRGVIGSPSKIVGDALVERLSDEKTTGHTCTLTVTVDNKQDRNSKKKDD
jgi:short subunit dehydrogenase-like uncharacterized protein